MTPLHIETVRVRLISPASSRLAPTSALATLELPLVTEALHVEQPRDKRASRAPCDSYGRRSCPLVADTVDDVRGEPELWGDFERHAVRTLAATLRSHVESVFEDFYFGPALTRDQQIARMCSDVGSLWRVHWSEIAKQLCEDSGHSLKPPE